MQIITTVHCPLFLEEIHLCRVYCFTVLYAMLSCQPDLRNSWKRMKMQHSSLASENIPIWVSCNFMHSTSTDIFSWLSFWVSQVLINEVSFLQHCSNMSGSSVFSFQSFSLDWAFFLANLNVQSIENLDIAQFPKRVDTGCNPDTFSYQSYQTCRTGIWDFTLWRLLWVVSSQFDPSD